MGGLVAFLTVGFRPSLCPESQAKNSENYLRYGEVEGKKKYIPLIYYLCYII
jgi:hypothetical protein